MPVHIAMRGAPRRHATQQGTLYVDGQKFGDWGAPWLVGTAGSLGLWSYDLSSYKDIHIRVLDPGEAFPPPS